MMVVRIIVTVFDYCRLILDDFYYFFNQIHSYCSLAGRTTLVACARLVSQNEVQKYVHDVVLLCS